MNLAAKPTPPSQLIAAGTFRPDRHADRVELGEEVESPILYYPKQPNWIGVTAKEVWADNIEHVLSTRMMNHKDAYVFALYCTAMAKVIEIVRGGDHPSAADIDTARKMGELFGIAGAKSRVVQRGAIDTDVPKNAFARNGKGRKAA